MTDHHLNKYAQTWRALSDAENEAAREAYLQSEDHRLHVQAEREATKRLYAFLFGFFAGLFLLVGLGVAGLRILFA